MATEIFKQVLPKASDLFMESALKILNEDGIFLICFTLFFLSGSFLLIRIKSRHRHG